MNGKAKLTNTNLQRSLNVACEMFRDYIMDCTGQITAEQIAMLPDVLFNLAVGAGWIPDLSESEKEWPCTRELDDAHAYLGLFIVKKSVRDDFLALIKDGLGQIEPYSTEIALRRQSEETRKEMHLDALREAAEEYQRLAVAAKKTAAELMDGWIAETGLSLEELAHQAGISTSTLYRIRGADFDYTTARGCESLKGLAAVLECDWQDLVPTKVTEE